MIDELKCLPQYHFDREEFCDAFMSVFKTNERITDILVACECRSMLGNEFLGYHFDDEYYIIHLPSGTMINWYKHLGRTNTCNKNLDIRGLIEFLILLDNDIKGG